MAEPNWTSIDPNLGGVTGQTWDTVGVDWEPAQVAPPDYAQPLTPTYYPQGPTRTTTFRYLLLDAGLGVIGELHPDRAHPPQITNRPSGAIKRRLTSFRLLPSEAAAVNPVVDRVRVEYVPGDGSDPSPLGIFMWADAVYGLPTSGLMLDSTLHDQGVILGQPIADTISFPTGHSIFDALFQVAAWSGFPNPIIEGVAGNFVAPQAWTVSESNTYYSVLAAIGQAAGTFEPYFGNTGQLRIRAVGDLTMVIPDIVYTDGPNGNIARGDLLVANNLLSAPNRYLIVNTAEGGGVVASYLVPDDAPHSYANRNWYSTRVVSVNGVTDAAVAEQMALSYARQDVDAFEEVMWEGVFDPRHDTLDVVRVMSDDLLETEWSATLSAGGVMAHKGKKLRHSEVRVPGGVPSQPYEPPPEEPPDTPPEEPVGETIIATYEAEDATLSSVAPPPAGTGQWSINAAGRFINPDGNRVRLLGMNGSVDVSGGQPFIFNYPRAAADGGGRETFTNRINDIVNWGWNAVRVTVVLTDGVYGQNSLNAVIDFLDDCVAAKVVCIVGVLESQDQTTNPVQGNSVFVNTVLPFFEDLLAARPNCAYLWCNPGMEAYESTDATAWANFHTWLYNSLRGYTGGANNIITVTSYNSGQTPVPVATWNTFASGKTNVVLDWHTYAAPGDAAWHESWRQTLRNANVPFVVNEFGQDIDGVNACCGANFAPEGGYNRQHAVLVQNIEKWYAQDGESIVGWIATGDASGQYDHAMRGTAGAPYGYTSYSVALSDYGQRMWNVRSLAKVY